MKKIICMIMAVIMVMSLVACGDKTPEATDPVGTENVTPDVTDTPDATDTPDVTEPGISEPASFATQIVDTFNAILAEPGAGDYNLEEIANKLAAADVFSACPSIVAMQTEVGPTWLAGFSEEVDGYKAAYAVAPMISSIPLVSYVFEMEEGADVNAFVDTLTAKHNLAWNICTSADEMQCIINGNYVFFVMAPLTMEEDAPVEDDVVDVPVEDDTTPVEDTTPVDGTEGAEGDAPVEDDTATEGATETDGAENNENTKG